MVEIERSKCCLGRKKPVLARVRILCALSGGCTGIAPGGRRGGVVVVQGGEPAGAIGESARLGDDPGVDCVGEGVSAGVERDGEKGEACWIGGDKGFGEVGVVGGEAVGGDRG